MKNKPTDLQRAVMRAAVDADPCKRVVGAQYEQATKLLAERGYITLTAREGGSFQVALSDRAVRKCGGHTKHGVFRTSIHTWRRFPPLPRHP